MAWRFVAMVALIGSLTLSSAGAQSGISRHIAKGPPSTYADKLERLLIQSIPGRNLYALADQLKLRPPRPIPHVVRTTTPNYPVGRDDRFFVLSEDGNHYFTINASIRVKTAHLYIYVQNGVNFDQAGMQKSATTFEHSTYPTDRSYFGTEWTPGVSNDPHITLLVADLKSSGVAGYFSAEDEYPHLVNPYSNQRQMVYMDVKGAAPGTSSFDSVLAHEFQHMIHFHMHPRENVWLNEGMSMLAEKLNGFPPVSEPDAFTAQPTTQLNTWNQSASANIAHYGGAYLYLAYLYNRFGRGLIRDILADKTLTDFELINDVVLKRHIHFTADQLFAQWAVANTVNDKSVGNGIYAYPEIPQTVDVQKTASAPFSYQASIPPYAAQFVLVNNQQGASPYHLRFSAGPTVPVVSAGQATPFWWSSRGDLIDSRLVRSVDLTRVRHATLHFNTWYDIEKNYDYAYVEVSTDGGKTFDTLRGTSTSTANPYGANYGFGYTGTTKSFQAETVDLSRYAGHRILLRLEYITDEGYNGQSWVVKDMSIPEIGWRDTFTGWTQQGFVPVLNNALPSRWTVQLVSYTSKGIQVSRLKLHAGTGSILIDPAKQGLKKLVVVVFTTAPKTTVKTPFTLSAG